MESIHTKFSRNIRLTLGDYNFNFILKFYIKNKVFIHIIKETILDFSIFFLNALNKIDQFKINLILLILFLSRDAKLYGILKFLDKENICISFCEKLFILYGVLSRWEEYLFAYYWINNYVKDILSRYISKKSVYLINVWRGRNYYY